MSASHDIHALARRYAALMESGTVADAENVLSPDFKFHPPGSPAPLNREDWKHFTSMFQSAFPDLRYTVESAIVEGDTIAERLRFEGTHQGMFQGIAPTGKRVDFSGMSMARVANGHIVELWGQFDALGLMQQLGALPTAGQTTG